MLVLVFVWLGMECSREDNFMRKYVFKKSEKMKTRAFYLTMWP